jgi:hypothetical protein
MPHPNRFNLFQRPGTHRYSSTVSLSSALGVVGGQRHTLADLPSSRNLVPILLKAEWVPGSVWTIACNPPPPGFDRRRIQPVASRYTAYAMPTHIYK